MTRARNTLWALLVTAATILVLSGFGTFVLGWWTYARGGW
jgi:hypothetical protein